MEAGKKISFGPFLIKRRKFAYIKKSDEKTKRPTAQKEMKIWSN